MFNATENFNNNEEKYFCKLGFVSKDLTFYGNYKLGYYRQYFLTPSSSQEIINALVGIIIEADFDLTIFSLPGQQRRHTDVESL